MRGAAKTIQHSFQSPANGIGPVGSSKLDLESFLGDDSWFRRCSGKLFNPGPLGAAAGVISSQGNSLLSFVPWKMRIWAQTPPGRY